MKLLSKTVYKQMVPVSKSFKLQKGQVTAFFLNKTLLHSEGVQQGCVQKLC